MAPFDEVYHISALTNDGVPRLESALISHCSSTPTRPFEFPPSEVTDQSVIQLASEIIRENIFSRIHDELPYRIQQNTVGWTDLPDGSVRIDQEWTVESKSQKQILLAGGGNIVQFVIQKSLPALRKLLNRQVHLFVRVSTR